MNQAERAELLEQIEKWNDADEFARCIEAIEAIPERERDYLLTLKLGRAYSNLAVLSDRGALGENAEVDGDLLRHAIDSGWSPTAPRVRTIPTGMLGWATPA